MASSTIAASDLLAAQRALVADAAAAIPHRFDACTHALGALKQLVHACVTCGGAGVCAACAVACHSEHEQVELFARRNFTCDCPTARGGARCCLVDASEQPRPPNDVNVYGRNFTGAFCRCGRTYDPESECETMVQCLACEDWFHESCLHLRERPSSRPPSPTPPPPPLSDTRQAPEPSIASALLGHPPSTSTPADNDADDDSDASEDGALLPADAYDSLVCGACVARVPFLWPYAGHEGTSMIVREQGGAWIVLGAPILEEDDENIHVDDVCDDAAAGAKRRLSNAPAPEAKRARVDADADAGTTAPPDPAPASPHAATCKQPTPHPLASVLLSHAVAEAPSAPDTATHESACDLFLSSGFRERWCRCSSCLPSFAAHPYFLTDEETYEPPADPDRGRSLEDLGMAALARLPRAQALDGVRAFGALQAQLTAFLRPFAQEGRVVSEGDVRAFFEEREEERRRAGA